MCTAKDNRSDSVQTSSTKLCFKQICGSVRIQQYLTQKKDEENVGLIQTEDFNFPSRAVEWVNSEEGTLPNVKPGSTLAKVALNLLLELTINFSLEKIVKGSTREENTLDLVLINDVETFTYCGSIVMAPISDHRMTTFNVTDTSGERKEFENTSK